MRPTLVHQGSLVRVWRRCLWAGFVAVAGCHGPSPTPTEPSSGPVEAQASRAPPAAVRTAPDEPPALTPRPNVTVPPMQRVVPIASPFPLGTIVVRPTNYPPPIVLFTDEDAAMRAGVAAALTRLGHAVAPPARVEQIEHAAAQGQLLLEDLQVCRSPLSPAEVAHRYFDRLPTAELDASCADQCTVVVTTSPPLVADGEEYADTYTSLAFKHGHDPRAWIRAAKSVKKRTLDTGIVGYVGGLVSSHPPPIMVSSVDSIGPWAEAPNRDSFEALGRSLQGCARTNRHTAFSWLVQLSVARNGKVQRCLATSDHAQALPSNATCVCSAMQELQFPNGRSGRRVRVDARDTGRFADEAVGFKMLQAGTEPWVRRLEQSTVLADCEATLGRTAGLTATAVLDLDPDGSIHHAQVIGDITTMPAMQWARCLVRSLPAVRLPCRPPGIDQLQVTVTTAK